MPMLQNNNQRGLQFVRNRKNDYVLTPDDVTDINVNDIKNSFQGNGFEDEFKYK